MVKGGIVGGEGIWWGKIEILMCGYGFFDGFRG